MPRDASLSDNECEFSSRVSRHVFPKGRGEEGGGGGGKPSSTISWDMALVCSVPSLTNNTTIIVFKIMFQSACVSCFLYQTHMYNYFSRNYIPVNYRVHHVILIKSNYIYTCETAAFGGISLALRGCAALGGVSAKKKIGAPHLVLKLLQDHEDSEYVLSFEIGKRENGFYNGRTDRQTDKAQYDIII